MEWSSREEPTHHERVLLFSNVIQLVPEQQGLRRATATSHQQRASTVQHRAAASQKHKPLCSSQPNNAHSPWPTTRPTTTRSTTTRAITTRAISVNRPNPGVMVVKRVAHSSNDVCHIASVGLSISQQLCCIGRRGEGKVCLQNQAPQEEKSKKQGDDAMGPRTNEWVDG